MRSDEPEVMDEADAPKFTVNQIVLLQKLKQSGLTKNQIVKGLEEMEKLEDIGLGSPGISGTTRTPVIAYYVNAHSTTPSLPNGNSAASPNSHCSTGSISNTTTNQLQSKDTEVQRNSSSPSSPRIKFSMGSVPHPLSQPNPLMFGTHLQNPNQLSLIPPVGTWPNTSQAVAVATAASLLQNGFAHGAVPPSAYPGLISNRGLVRNGGSGGGSTIIKIDEEEVDITEDLEELFRRDQAAVKEDIRKFISERHISQSAIAKATRNAISQSYISQWLAQPQDISGQKKKAMYTWYLAEKRKPPGMSNGMGTFQHVPSYRSGDNDQDGINPILLKAKRGARFTWPKECLSILENYYNANSYPDECKREEIAHACNSIIQAQKPGMMLSDLDKVTTVKVYNWFANRRKDDKRRRHIENVEAMSHSQIIMSPRRSSTISPSPSCNSTDSHHDGDTANISDRGITNIKKENPMSYAMEMAAVNHSILALVNPHHDSTSHDDEDDDEHDSAFDNRLNDRKDPYHRPERMAECRSYAG